MEEPEYYEEIYRGIPLKVSFEVVNELRDRFEIDAVQALRNKIDEELEQ